MDASRRRARVEAISNEMARRGLTEHAHYAARAAVHDGALWALLEWDRARHQNDEVSRLLAEHRLATRYGPTEGASSLEEEIESLREELSGWVLPEALDRIAEAARTNRRVLFLLQDAAETDTPGDLEEMIDALRRHIELPERVLGGPRFEELERDYDDGVI